MHLFVVFYEEPTLRGMFGADYEEYSRNVGRWWPRVRGWDKRQGQATQEVLADRGAATRRP